ncbi:MAG: DUF6790 family protein [Chlamydiales bacterium]
MYPLALFIIAVLAACIHFFISKKKTFARFIELSLAYMIPLNIGVATLIGFISHAFFGPETAEQIGWPAHNPFQFEVAVGNLAMSAAGFLCIWQKKGFWLATTIFSGIFFLGAAVGHIVQMVVHGNYSPYNSGPFLYIGDIAIPLVYLTLALIYSAQNRFFKSFEQ